MSRHVRTVITTFLIATFAALTFRLFVVEDYRIASDSMAPYLRTGDLVFVSKFSYNLRLPFSSFELVTIKRPARGDVVAFMLPDRPLDTLVKRVVALDGDSVQIKGGTLIVNGKLVQESYPVLWDKSVTDYGPVIVPPGHFFALGDNRTDNVDSRTWGPVPYPCLKGHVALVWASRDHSRASSEAGLVSRASVK